MWLIQKILSLFRWLIQKFLSFSRRFFGMEVPDVVYRGAEVDFSSEPEPIQGKFTSRKKKKPDNNLNLNLENGIDDIVREHNKWLSSEGRHGKRAVRRGEDFRKSDLNNICLDGAVFDGSNFSDNNASWSTFKFASLRGAIFEYTNLKGTDFTHADLDGANFDRADLSGTVFREANLRGASFAGARNLDSKQLAGAVLSEATLPYYLGSLSG